MNGIKMSDCRFYVLEDERIVVCVIPNTRDLVVDFIIEHFQWKDCNLYDAISWRFEEYRMPRSFMGKAICSKEDEWNEEVGKLIAFSRAKDKCYKSFFKRANAFIQKVDTRLGDAIELFNNFGAKLEYKREALKERIEELCPQE